jgi:uncharacterized membrane protein YccC
VEWEQAQVALQRAKTRLDQNQNQRAKLEARLLKVEARLKSLAPRQIRQVDVALDSVLTSTKLTGAQLISFVLREYLREQPMSPQTFVARVLPVRGRKEVTHDTETIIFHENPRDPEVTDALAAACRRLNARRLIRDGRRLHYTLELVPGGEE